MIEYSLQANLKNKRISISYPSMKNVSPT